MKAAVSERAILNRLRRGDSVASISRWSRIRRPNISEIAKTNNIVVRRGRPFCDSTRGRIMDAFWSLFEAGTLESLEQVAATIPCSRAYVSAVLDRADVAATELIALCKSRRNRIPTAQPPSGPEKDPA